MWRFLGCSQEPFFPPSPFLPPLLVAPSYKHVITRGLRLKTWQPNNSATCYYKLHGILAGGVMTVQTEKPAGYSERKASRTSFTSFSAVFTQGPWHSGPVRTSRPDNSLELSQSSLRRQPSKVTDNRKLSLFTSSLPGLFYKEQRWRPEAKRNCVFCS